ncbi:MAG TPA: hypothetical protein VE090_01895 [Methylomirabilota bacterium]|nr:hypothetical protein [Methylomirabilota bacterium]
MDSILRQFNRKQKQIPLPPLAEVEDYIRASMVPVHRGTKCVDGRYLPNQASGMLARPGADGGYVMVLEAVNRKKGLGLTPEQCFNAVFKAIQKLQGTFYLHTDQHVDPNDSAQHGLIGCGHLAKAARRGFSWEYDIRSKDVKKMVNYARNLSKISSGVEMINLEGEHREKGVFVVHSDRYTILADNPNLKQMYFIYDVDRDRAFMKQLVEEMNIEGVDLKDMSREADLQLDATLQNLAVGLPLYDVKFKGKEPQLTLVERITHKPFLSRMHMPLHPHFSFFGQKN